MDVLNPEARERQRQTLRLKYKRGELFIPNQMGFKHSRETKKIISNVSKNQWKSEEYREKYNKSREYMKTDEGYLKKLSEGAKRMWKDERVRQKIINSNTGQKRNFIQRQNLSIGRQGINLDEWDGFVRYKNKKYPYDFNFRFRSEIKKIDGFSCVLCKSKSNLHVHHIDKNISHNTPKNCITLCIDCHGLVHRIDTFDESRKRLKNLRRDI